MTTGDLQRDSHYAHYLWHLNDAGVIRLAGDGGPVPRYRVEDTVWDDLYGEGEVEPTLVAVIDNGCSTTHTHLPPGDCLVASPCFATHDFGALHVTGRSGEDMPRSDAPGVEEKDPCLDREGRLNHFRDAAARDGAFWTRIDRLAEIVGAGATCDRLRLTIEALHETEGTVRALTSYAEDFSVHGTQTAGLIAARPPARRNALPYFGVDPRARILALNTSLRPDARGLIHALLYAVGRGAGVICIPRAIWRAPDEVPSPLPTPDPRATRLDRDEELRADGRLLDQLLVAIGAEIPVVLAAGNNGFAEDSVYPASLASDGNGLISVGALNGHGNVSGYSNTLNATLFAPSDDAEIWDRAQRRLDPESETLVRHAVPARPERGQAMEAYSGWGILSTDVPGALGDSSGGLSPHEDGETPGQSSEFALFGGTSGACAIVAGVASLVQAAHHRARGRRMSGPEMKHHLRLHCDGSRQLSNGEPVLRVDARAALGALRH